LNGLADVINYVLLFEGVFPGQARKKRENKPMMQNNSFTNKKSYLVGCAYLWWVEGSEIDKIRKTLIKNRILFKERHKQREREKKA